MFREYQFNFNLPGSRANGMGGAFIGLADDATASFANPAGLAFLSETAVTLEYRHRDLNTRQGEIEGAFNSVFTQEGITLDHVTFLSVNFKWKGLYFGVFQYEYLNEEQMREFTSRSLVGGEQRVESRDISLDLNGTTRGLGIARRFGKYKIGLTLNYLDLAGKTEYTREGFVASIPPSFSSFQSSIDDRDAEWGFSLGLLHEVSDKFSWGVVWRDHPRFTLKETASETFNLEPVFLADFDVPFKVPDVLGAGVRYRIRPSLSVLADWQKIFYGQIIDDGFIIVESLETETEENYTIDDIDEVHLGAEWLLPTENSVWAFRGGFYRNPLHTVSYTGDDPAIQARFAGTGLTDENHVTFGVGWVFRNRIEVGISANLWEEGQEFTASFIWRKK